ncbi:MAG: YraN family protein [Clostridiales bacterium]|nr:YraN family protein [Clostridiales bacterium]
MDSSKDKGDLGEQAAVEYLIKNGYSILQRNFRTRYGEIDIIGRDEDYIAFIEVKTRKNNEFGLPCEAVTKNKQNKIIRMAMMYISQKRLYGLNFRFDVVETIISNDEIRYLRLIKNAFDADSII